MRCAHCRRRIGLGFGSHWFLDFADMGYHYFPFCSKSCRKSWQAILSLERMRGIDQVFRPP